MCYCVKWEVHAERNETQDVLRRRHHHRRRHISECYFLPLHTAPLQNAIQQHSSADFENFENEFEA